MFATAASAIISRRHEMAIILVTCALVACVTIVAEDVADGATLRYAVVDITRH